MLLYPDAKKKEELEYLPECKAEIFKLNKNS
jgi:hypothetical protein